MTIWSLFRISILTLCRKSIYSFEINRSKNMSEWHSTTVNSSLSMDDGHIHMMCIPIVQTYATFPLVSSWPTQVLTAWRMPHHSAYWANNNGTGCRRYSNVDICKEMRNVRCAQMRMPLPLESCPWVRVQVFFSLYYLLRSTFLHHDGVRMCHVIAHSLASSSESCRAADTLYTVFFNAFAMQ